MSENKKQFYISDKPIDLSEIEPITGESLKTSIDWEEATKPHTISFDCEVSKETADLFKKQMKELHKESARLTEHYMQKSIETVENFIKNFGVFFVSPDKEIDDKAKSILISMVFSAFYNGWKDCFDYNVKHKKH